LAGLLLTAPAPVEESPSGELFVVGDSISIQYGPFLDRYLEGLLKHDRKRNDGGAPADSGVYDGENGGDSRSVAEYLAARADDTSFRPDFLLVNCGLHDIRRRLDNAGAYQVAPEDYRANLEKIVRVSKGIGTQLVWVRTTPVVDSIHNQPGMEFHRYAADQKEYNAIADQVFTKHLIPIIDLDTFTRKLGEGIFIDHVHFNETTRALQAAFIAGFLNRLIK
jgi:hypothetical protein